YQIVRLLGRGAFARVYLAWDEATSTQIVVKISVSDVAEARLAGPLDHPAVIPIKHARALPTGVSYLVTPFLGCATLLDVLDAAFASAARPACAKVLWQAQQQATQPGDQIPQDATMVRRFQERSYLDGATTLLAELAGGLAFLHEHGILHRDLKPSN